ncbi:hypothetical protein F5884DRAFT_117194 [Xylogone sp. PMI_703]|nr:hypothetical protein F5884DRAFT_117194 [Xylogone sp. PMI_703]
MADTKILLTGATGYIGGAILDSLLDQEYITLNKSNITVLVRGEKNAQVFASKGVTTMLFNSLDDTDVLAEAASQHDIVIHAASGFHTLSARALVLGLAQRKKETGKEVFYIHTSGTSNVADRPLTKKYTEANYPLSDKEINVFEYEKRRDEEVPYAQRTSDVVVTELGKEYGVKTYILMSPSIYGIASSPLHEFCHTPKLIRLSLELGQAPVVGDGSAIWDHAHIIDVARVYKLVVAKIFEGADIPNGKNGIYFIQQAEHSWRELSQMVADAGVAAGALKTNELRSLSLKEAADSLAGGRTLLGEIGWASNSRTRGGLARELGWAPKKTEEDWKNHAAEDWKNILASIENA